MSHENHIMYNNNIKSLQRRGNQLLVTYLKRHFINSQLEQKSSSMVISIISFGIEIV